MAKKDRINPFKELERSLLEVPPEMKKKVMNDIATAKLIIDMGSLYTYNYPAAVKEVLRKKKGNRNK
ncbi:hypothetical protein [Muriicola sp. Z0-33]|uniref:hypothetical protein n=1 Tax=Muriicola sp. Z0-33 TaxID=2816957 RepID=UPI002237DD9A|nr:hypothetical protein [Muriicola sp. Z0-33]MCW5517698.1 hypothetical protein [Muriicola sp. Z0-33]